MAWRRFETTGRGITGVNVLQVAAAFACGIVAPIRWSVAGNWSGAILYRGPP